VPAADNRRRPDPPVITCPGDRTFQCDQEVVFGQATAVDVGDPDPVITYVDNEIPGNCDQARVIERTWIATDACGNADSCLQVVRVVDNTPPVITCPANRDLQLQRAAGVRRGHGDRQLQPRAGNRVCGQHDPGRQPAGVRDRTDLDGDRWLRQQRVVRAAGIDRGQLGADAGWGRRATR